MSERARPATGRLPGTVWIPASAMLLVIVAVAGAMIGPAGPDWWRVPLALAERAPLLDRLGIDSGVTEREWSIIWNIRMPRVVLAGIVGATLSLGGASYQGVFRNPLVDPYLLGAAAGGGLGATLVIATWGGLGDGWIIDPVPVVAFVFALGTVADATLATRVGVVVAIAALMTLGVYGLVAAIVKLDDAGMALMERDDPASQRLGALVLSLAPQLMKALSVLGTAAMFLVGGGILVHGMPLLAHALHGLEHAAAALPAGGILSVLAAMTFNGLAGLLAGAVVVAGVEGVAKLRGAPPE